ncbi:hypothetical protein M1590_01910 [Candidatus Marsarchaeota archaeon]|nr:hypothetical protein [Candidatus Marsarchaeota archaeon]
MATLTKADQATDGMAKSAAEKILAMTDCISDRFFVSTPVKETSIADRSPEVVLSVLSAALYGNELVYGNWGLGKTTLSEVVSSIMFGLPRGVIRDSEAHGDPEVTKEEFIAMPELPEMKRILWRPFTLLTPKVFDEFNRMPSAKESLFLDAIDRGNFEYMNHTLRSEGPVFATVNWPDSANVDMVLPMLDRFDIGIMVERPNPLLRNIVRGMDYSILEDESVSKEILRYLSDSSMEPGEKMSRIAGIAERFRPELSSRLGIPLPTAEELAALRSYLNHMPFDDDANNYRIFLESEMQCPVHSPAPGQTHPEGCHYGGSEYAFLKLATPVSVRMTNSLDRFSAALSLTLGDDCITTGSIAAIFPYVLWHRVEFSDSFKSSNSLQGISDGIELARVLGEGIYKRFEENFAQIGKLQEILVNGTAIDQLRQNDHPLFQYAARLLRG